ncbi:TetR/AcrR family transcriptional regulator [Tsukamurella paurometabola]|uniref:TetR family transcriptional regulator C-terminal domain-containing protein n=1 Tax=Tsukamurella paurometabola TaxID=2061 RepID=A0A3P8MD22_TSUPA|nr:TetR family transcriptional regulator C-terminal domain-containing protein [Tsukamurella paurometabola]MBS4101387.1 TetR family transcriptional regulator C-terminal domain-containing protein [Tsukamurella paurometabola]UEA84134.1 TetR family transcriptional regulator C-terminal domain-containing protein [Tsukamurella paurometabola]VDR41300.1 transcriptional regulator BetI [Tsukamurella paurometabola]
MPKQVDHRERREVIARALWRVVDQRGVLRLSLREVAKEAGMSHGQVQHYFTSRRELLTFAMDFAADRTGERVGDGLAELGPEPHPRAVLRVTLTEMLPLHPDARATSRMSAAYVLEALHDDGLRVRARDGMLRARAQVEELIAQAIADGLISADRAPSTETDRLLAVTGLTPLLDLGVITAEDALAAVDRHLDDLFDA